MPFVTTCLLPLFATPIPTTYLRKQVLKGIWFIKEIVVTSYLMVGK